MARISRAWPAQYLIFSTPLITFSLVGPGFLHVLDAQDLDIVKLALKRLARYWTIAEILLGKDEIHQPYLLSKLIL